MASALEEAGQWVAPRLTKFLPPFINGFLSKASRGPRTVLLFHGPEYDRLFFRDLVACLSREFERQPLDMVCVVAQTQGGLDQVLDAMEKDRGRLAGVIVLPTSLNNDCKANLERRLPKLRVPAVVLDKETELRGIAGELTGRIYFDNAWGTMQLREALNEQPHREGWWAGHSRRLSHDEMVRAQCRDSWADELAVDAQAPRETALRALLSRLKDRSVPEDGLDIVCVNDDVAAGVDDALQCWSALLGKRPDVRVFSFDCSSETVRRQMSIETFFAGGVSQSPHLLAKNAVLELLSLMRKTKSGPRDPLRPELVIAPAARRILDPA